MLLNVCVSFLFFFFLHNHVFFNKQCWKNYIGSIVFNFHFFKRGQWVRPGNCCKIIAGDPLTSLVKHIPNGWGKLYQVYFLQFLPNKLAGNYPTIEKMECPILFVILSYLLRYVKYLYNLCTTFYQFKCPSVRCSILTDRWSKVKAHDYYSA